MAISFIGAANGTTSTSNLSTAVDDLLIGCTFRDGNNTAPTIPAGWTPIESAAGSDNNGSSLAYKWATGTSEASGTWTSATTLIIGVYRGVNKTTPIGAHAVNGGSGSSTINYPALSLTNTAGDSEIVAFAGHRQIDTNLESPPTGMTFRNGVVDGTDEMALFDTNGGAASWPSTNKTLTGTNGGWRTHTVELIPAVTLTSKSGTDTPTVEITESKSLAASSSRTDTPTVAISESSSLAKSSARADSISVSISESASIIVSLNRSESLNVSAGEALGIVVGLSRTDTLSVSAPETSGNALSLQRADAPTLAVSEASSNLLALSRADTLALNIGDVSGDDAPIPIEVSEALSVQVSDSSTSTISLSRSDAAELSVLEARSLASSSARADTVGLNIADGSTISAAANPSDVVAVEIVEEASVVVLIAVSDAAGVAVSEVRAIASILALIDSINILLSHGGTIFVPSIRSDSVAVGISESSSVSTSEGEEDISRADAVAVGISESYKLKISGPVDWLAGDRTYVVDSEPRALSAGSDDRDDPTGVDPRREAVPSPVDATTWISRRDKVDTISLQISEAGSVSVV